jgi:hypothetical protein
VVTRALASVLMSGTGSATSKVQLLGN